MLYDLFSNKNNGSACEQLKLIMSIVTRASTKKCKERQWNERIGRTLKEIMFGQ